MIKTVESHRAPQCKTLKAGCTRLSQKTSFCVIQALRYKKIRGLLFNKVFENMLINNTSEYILSKYISGTTPQHAHANPDWEIGSRSLLS